MGSGLENDFKEEKGPPRQRRKGSLSGRPYPARHAAEHIGEAPASRTLLGRQRRREKLLRGLGVTGCAQSFLRVARAIPRPWRWHAVSANTRGATAHRKKAADAISRSPELRRRGRLEMRRRVGPVGLTPALTGRISLAGGRRDISRDITFGVAEREAEFGDFNGVWRRSPDDVRIAVGSVIARRRPCVPGDWFAIVEQNA